VKISTPTNFYTQKSKSQYSLYLKIVIKI